MTRFYDPITRTEAFEGIHNLDNAISSDDMPEEYLAYFNNKHVLGKVWVNDSTGRYPIEIDIAAPTLEENKEIQRSWATSELFATDRTLLPDSPYTDQEQTQIKIYRAALRNPAREQTAGYPEPSWRPVWPAGIKRPDS